MMDDGCLMHTPISHQRSLIKNHPLMVGSAGFEPAKAIADRFTVCSHWPLGQLPGTREKHYTGRLGMMGVNWVIEVMEVIFAAKHPRLERP
jgi:hypothetical protein